MGARLLLKHNVKSYAQTSEDWSIDFRQSKIAKIRQLICKPLRIVQMCEDVDGGPTLAEWMEGSWPPPTGHTKCVLIGPEWCIGSSTLSYGLVKLFKSPTLKVYVLNWIVVGLWDIRGQLIGLLGGWNSAQLMYMWQWTNDECCINSEG